MKARQLCREWGLETKHQLYRKDGAWFHLLRDFPGALLDENGYIIFVTKEDYESCPGLVIKQETNQLHCYEGISTLPGYVRVKLNADEPIPLAEELQEPTYIEGARKQITVNAYERDPKARAKCIEIYGTRCAVCYFNFEAFYGSVGKGFIHVHHLKPLSRINDSYEVNPETDLRPVCPNCHAMLHRQKETLTIEELKQIIAKSNT
ncbi:MAG TPA: HNH endonuclease [Abditibacteriaceae bacterium]|jgi:hypothetical protein